VTDAKRAGTANASPLLIGQETAGSTQLNSGSVRREQAQKVSQERCAMTAKIESWRDVLPVHPAADLFPLMRETDPDGFKALVEDIKENGLRTPIAVMCDRSSNGTFTYRLLDGRNRLDAIEHAGFHPTDVPRRGRAYRRREGLECGLSPLLGLDTLLGISSSHVAIEYVSPDDPVAFITSANIHRRHLATAEQKLELIAKLRKANPEKSNRQIADMVKASPTTVGKVTAKLEAAGAVSTVDTRTDTKGRKQPAKKKTTVAKAAERRADFAAIDADEDETQESPEAADKEYIAVRERAFFARAREALNCANMGGLYGLTISPEMVRAAHDAAEAWKAIHHNLEAMRREVPSKKS
jgi:DNA-binding Lrp family transcriptional regulator